jgi:hypothetical protein
MVSKRTGRFKPGEDDKTSAQLSLPDKPSIAVLPFQNMSGDPVQEYSTDGMVEDIVTGLSRIKWLFVIARNSSFVYKGKSTDVGKCRCGGTEGVRRHAWTRYQARHSAGRPGRPRRLSPEMCSIKKPPATGIFTEPGERCPIFAIRRAGHA